MKLPVFPSLRESYGWTPFLGDCSGGLIAALIALPYGLAMASLMGLPPVLGVFTSILTAPVIALLGRNPVLIGGTASATVPFIALAVRTQGIGGAAKVSIVASVIMMAFCVLRLGRHITRVPHAVVTGFSCGIGAMMITSQLDIILGVASPLSRTANTAVGQLANAVARIGEARVVPLLLGLTVIVAATLAARWSPRIPAPLVGVGLAFLLGRLLGVREREVGAITASFPDFVGFSWNPRDAFSVLPSAFALAFVSSVNILITSRVVEHFQGRHRRMTASAADAELGAYGIANVFAGMIGAPPSVGIPARSLAVVRCGGSTRSGESDARRLFDRHFGTRLAVYLARPSAGARWRDGVDGPLPSRLEHLAAIAEDEHLGRSRVPRQYCYSRFARKCRAGGRDWLFALRRACYAGTPPFQL